MEIIVTGVLLGGTYALIALGLTLQYGVARIMNLANGETLVAACFSAWLLFTAAGVNPLWGLLIIAPLGFVANGLIYLGLLRPLVRRAKTQGMLEVDSILATFGLLFLFEGAMQLIFGGSFFNYQFLAVPFEMLGGSYGLNRAVAFLAAAIIAAGLYLFLYRTRFGTAVRAVAVDPDAARLVAINVGVVAAFAFALGGAITASGGALLSTFYTFNASMGAIFTMKALIIVIMGGVGDVRGATIAALMLGVMETLVASLIDPGLTLAATYGLFIIVLLFRPQGLFGVTSRMTRVRIPDPRHRRRRLRLRTCAMLPFLTEGFYLTLAVNVALYVALCTAWSLFSGPTHLVSLATAAFFGIGTYAVAIGIGHVPFPVLILCGGLAGALFAAIVGAATLRLSGVYFVIFTLGLAELTRQIVAYLQTKVFALDGPLRAHRPHRGQPLPLPSRADRGDVHRRLADRPLAPRVRDAGDRQ